MHHWPLFIFYLLITRKLFCMCQWKAIYPQDGLIFYTYILQQENRKRKSTFRFSLKKKTRIPTVYIKLFATFFSQAPSQINGPKSENQGLISHELSQKHRPQFWPLQGHCEEETWPNHHLYVTEGRMCKKMSWHGLSCLDKKRAARQSLSCLFPQSEDPSYSHLLLKQVTKCHFSLFATACSQIKYPRFGLFLWRTMISNTTETKRP